MSGELRMVVVCGWRIWPAKAGTPCRLQTVEFTNAGWKALAIGGNTTAHYAGSLTVNDLTIDAPTDSFNQLLLNWAGLSVPLVVRSNFIVGPNGSLASHSSALRAANSWFYGPATFSDSSVANLDEITLTPGVTLTLNDGLLTSSNITFLCGTLIQAGGTYTVQTIDLPGARLPQYPSYNLSERAYFLERGSLISGNVSVGWFNPFYGGARGYFYQSGGVHTNSSLGVHGFQRHYEEMYLLGFYFLSGGVLASPTISVSGGAFGQSGGTNYAGELTVSSGGYYVLDGGQLVTSNTTVSTSDCRHQDAFGQNGGSHTVQNGLLVQYLARYSLSAGALRVPFIQIEPGSELQLYGGAVSNSGLVVLHGGGVRVGSVPQQLGKLQVLEGSGYDCSTDDITYATLYADSTNAPTMLRFQDSRDVVWSGILQIKNWSTNHSGYGPDHIFFGTNSEGLTPDQLSRVTFVRPSESFSDYSAAITASGELVPDATPAQYFNYTTTNGTITIDRYIGLDRDLTVPNTINGLPVTSIGGAAFANCTSLTSIAIPSSVTTIGDSAFRYCTSLTAVYFQGNAPSTGSVFLDETPTVYYLPGTIGWGATFAGRPTVPWFRPRPTILNFGPSFAVHSNRFGFIVSWATNVPVIIEASTNLANPAWSALSTNNLTNGAFYFSDPLWTNYPGRFYRIRSP